MDDRQLRIGQRPPAQVSSVPVDFTVTRGGAAVETEGFVLVVNTGGLQFVKAYLTLTNATTATGTLQVTVPYLESVPTQVFGTMGILGSINGDVPVKITAGVIAPVNTLSSLAAGDTISIQGVL